MRIIQNIWIFFLFHRFFVCLKIGKFSKAEKIVRMIESISSLENLLSSLMKSPVFYAKNEILAFRCVSRRALLYIENSEKLNVHEKRYLKNFVYSFYLREGDRLGALIDNDFDYEKVSALYIKRFPYKKEGGINL